MNVLDAARNIAGKVGMQSLSDLTGIEVNLLRAKLNKDNPRNRFYLEEAVQIQSCSGHYDILHAMSAELGHVSLPLPNADSSSLPQAVTRACAEFGDYMRKVDEVFDDGEVTPNEIKALEKELTEMVAAAVRLQAVLKGKAT